MKKTMLALLASVALPMGAFALDAEAVKKQVVADVAAKIATPEIIAAIKAQNAAHAGLDDAGIKAKDDAWRAETQAAAKPMIDAVLANATSTALKAVKDGSAGMYTEIFIMDNKGLNVGQSDVTSDYWQGDEDKFSKSFGAGADGVFMDEVEFDESAQVFNTQVSVAIKDETGAAIGAVTVGVAAE
ncbi:MAG: hypothetical protein WAX89_08290 [Alphaproteobacteria bacterium]